MKKFVLAIAALFSEAGAVSHTRHGEDVELKYVFEIVRHGARAPMGADPNFPLPSEMLTAQGMRQRFLLGRYNFWKYSQDFGAEGFLDPANFEIQSTNVFRTIQSGYSELAGLMHQQQPKRLELSKQQQAALEASERGMPAFKVRNAVKMNKDLGKFAIVDGFVTVPIKTFIDDT